MHRSDFSFYGISLADVWRIDYRGRMETVAQGREVSDFHEMVVVGLGTSSQILGV